MGQYIYLSEFDRVKMKKVEDQELMSVFNEALLRDSSLLISMYHAFEKHGLIRRKKLVHKYTIYHECEGYGQARVMQCASGTKSVVMAYLYGIINAPAQK